MDTVDIKALNERIQQESSFVDMINMEMNKVIVGQKHLVEGLLIGMLSNGHILLEGVPGLAKTLAINTLATTIDAEIQSYSVYPRSFACRCDRYDDLFSEERRVCGKTRTDFCELHSGG